MLLPKKIQVCPIKDAVLEIRFESSVPGDAVFGMLYNQLSTEFTEMIRLPILQIPEQIRNQQQMLHQPHYRLTKGGVHVSIGPGMLSIGVKGEYPGWAIYSEEIRSVIGTLRSVPVVKNCSRFGLRYINHFAGDVTDRLTLSVNLEGVPLKGQGSFFRTRLKEDDYSILLSVVKDAKIDSQPPSGLGTVIDIDVFTELDKSATLEGVEKFMENAHETEKKLFFRLLNADFLTSLKPEY
jgi:uncharacterized protein (TIGR04255 family)